MHSPHIMSVSFAHPLLEWSISITYVESSARDHWIKILLGRWAYLGWLSWYTFGGCNSALKKNRAMWPHQCDAVENTRLGMQGSKVAKQPGYFPGVRPCMCPFLPRAALRDQRFNLAMSLYLLSSLPGTNVLWCRPRLVPSPILGSAWKSSLPRVLGTPQVE